MVGAKSIVFEECWDVSARVDRIANVARPIYALLGVRRCDPATGRGADLHDSR